MLTTSGTNVMSKKVSSILIQLYISLIILFSSPSFAVGNNAAYKFCRDNYLSMSALQDIRGLRETFRSHLIENSLYTVTESDPLANSTMDVNLLRCVMAAGLGKIVRLAKYVENEGHRNGKLI